jgi:CRP/FNR family transcriptional regulator
MDSPEDRFFQMFRDLFPIDDWQGPRRDDLLAAIRFRDLEPDAAVLREGQVCSTVPFVISGSLRVFKTAESGREITLYRIEPGETCILGAGCKAALSSFPATVVAEGRTEAAFLPHDLVRRLVDEDARFREFLFAQFSRRMAFIMELVEEVAFRRVDERLKEWLAGERASRGGDMVRATHQEIADHLGTSREVVSRILKDWEERGALEISRGAMVLLPGFDSLPL